MRRRILFLPISGRTGASSRYRVYQYLPFLEECGYDAAVIAPARRSGRGIIRLARGLLDERACLRAAREADIVFIQKRLFSRGFLARLRRLGKKVIFDFDDSIFTSPEGDWSGPTRRKVQGRLMAAFGVSDVVIAGNEFLRDYALNTSASRVEVIPTALEPSKYTIKEHADGPVVLGWMGSSVNHRYLSLVSGVIRKLSAEFPGLKLRVVSDKDIIMDGVEVVNLRWSEETEADDLLKMDIGLMPLTDDDWTRGKCAFKAIQYMAAGLPAVCSPVGANMEAVENGVEGYLPADEEGWQDALRRLITSRERRAEMGRAGRAKVERLYSVGAAAPLYRWILESL